MSEEKDALRKAVRAQLKALNADAADAADRSRRAARFLTESTIYKESGAVLAFLSFGTEIQTHDLVRQMLADGKRVAVPRTFEDEAVSAFESPAADKASAAFKAAGAADSRMEFYWLSADEPLEAQVEKGDFGILVPLLPLPQVDPAVLPEKTLFVLPGVAFSKAGWRLGQGRGFYDRYIERLNAGESRQTHTAARAEARENVQSCITLAGFCYALQLVPEVPHDNWDKPVDCIITEDGVYPVSK